MGLFKKDASPLLRFVVFIRYDLYGHRVDTVCNHQNSGITLIQMCPNVKLGEVRGGLQQSLGAAVDYQISTMFTSACQQLLRSLGLPQRQKQNT